MEGMEFSLFLEMVLHSCQITWQDPIPLWEDIKEIGNHPFWKDWVPLPKAKHGDPAFHSILP